MPGRPARRAPARFSRHDEAFDRLVENLDTRYRSRHGACRIAARIVDNEDLVGKASLRKQRMQAGREKRLFIVGADHHADGHRPAIQAGRCLNAYKCTRLV
jgi:hypothetical protein